MTHRHTIKSSADLEELVKGDSVTRVRKAGDHLNIELYSFEMNKKGFKHLVLLSDLVTRLWVSEMTVSCEPLKSKISAAMAQFYNLESLTLWDEDVFDLSKFISPIQAQPASRFLTSVCFNHVNISAKRASRISKAFEYNKTLKSFEVKYLKQGESDLVPILRGSHALERMCLSLYYLTNAEFFTLCRFFVEYEKCERLQQLNICLEPAYMVFDRTYLKFGAIVAEKNVTQDLFLFKMPSTVGDNELISYAESIGGFEL